MTRSKTETGNFFEDFAVGQEFRHATPRTVTVGDTALYTALYGSRFALQSSDAFAQSLGLPRAPVDRTHTTPLARLEFSRRPRTVERADSVSPG
jgi:acyl dehydratase